MTLALAELARVEELSLILEGLLTRIVAQCKQTSSLDITKHSSSTLLGELTKLGELIDQFRVYTTTKEELRKASKMQHTFNLPHIGEGD
ncbi:MAG: hypothetical protein ACXABY_01265 [Candidatus Thorarchaeota archaeon]|jgi:hypothetical protein